MSRRVISTEKAPGAIGPYSQAVTAGDFFFSAMQIALDPVTGELTGDDAAAQTRRIMDNLRAVLEAAGLGFADVVKATVYVADLADFGAVNEVYATCFEADPPARAVVEVTRIPKDALVGIDLIACRGV